jgi:uncharacterized protein with NRDE domain
MCLILVAWRAHPDYPLVVAANRDEFFARRTAAASFWPDRKILAGRDLQAGGTWLGIHHGTGRFAALTNYRDPARQRDGLTSRGLLVTDFLTSDTPATSWLEGLARRATDYNGFNLMAGDANSLACLASITGEVRILQPGIYGLSNHLLDSPWPKVEVAKSALATALNAVPDDSPLFSLLHDDTIHPDDALPRTGVSLEWERLLSSAFVRAPGYGTRCSTVVMVGNDGTTVFDEQTWLEGAKAGPRIRYRFRPPAPLPSRHGECPPR